LTPQKLKIDISFYKAYSFLNKSRSFENDFKTSALKLTN